MLSTIKWVTVELVGVANRSGKTRRLEVPLPNKVVLVSVWPDVDPPYVAAAFHTGTEWRLIAPKNTEFNSADVNGWAYFPSPVIETDLTTIEYQ
jgi:hypothetical protein